MKTVEFTHAGRLTRLNVAHIVGWSVYESHTPIHRSHPTIPNVLEDVAEKRWLVTCTDTTGTTHIVAECSTEAAARESLVQILAPLMEDR